MSKPNWGRLQTLYDMMLTVPRGRVSLTSWREVEFGSTQDDWYTPRNERLLSHECKSMACAIGWACAYPPFLEQGLHWIQSGNVGEPCYVVGDTTHNGWSAVKEFFGLSESGALALFAYSYSFLDGGPDWELKGKDAVLARLERLFQLNYKVLTKPVAYVV